MCCPARKGELSKTLAGIEAGLAARFDNRVD